MHTESKPPKLVRPLGLLLAVLLALLVVGFIVLSCSVRTAVTQGNGFDNPPEEEVVVEPESQTISIDLVGDINLTDGWAIDLADAQGGSVDAVFSPELLEHLRSADIFYANHEFTMSDQGEPLNKYYTFRADPAKAFYWEQLGVDIVGLANNHVYDYGEAAFLDTMDILTAHELRYTGAGRDLSEAMSPVYYDFDGYIVAFVAADRSQKWDEVRAPEAAEDSPGVLFCFDDTLFLQAVATAAEHADYVIAIPHWGTENSTELEEVQVELAHKLIDGGADAVVGSHPHILQGMEIYQGKLIAYSLGNFWFNWVECTTLVLNIEISEGEASYRIIPALQNEQQLFTSDEITAARIQEMRALSPGLEISDSGVITVASEE